MLNEELKEKFGFMSAKEAAIKLGVTLSFFKVHVSKAIGRRIGSKKYYTLKDLESWLESQKNVNVHQN